MVAFTSLSLEQVSDFFDDLADDRLALFDVKRKGGGVITIKDFFRSYYHRRVCRYTTDELETARARFHLIFEDNKFILVKLERELECLYELGQIDKNWKDVHTSNITQETGGEITAATVVDNTQTDRRGIVLGDLQGTVDGSQFSKVKSLAESTTKSPDKVMGYLDPSARVRTQTLHQESGENLLTVRSSDTQTNKSTGTFTSSTLNTSSNASRDYTEFLYLRLPEIRREFLSSFEILFLF